MKSKYLEWTRVSRITWWVQQVTNGEALKFQKIWNQVRVTIHSLQKPRIRCQWVISHCLRSEVKEMRSRLSRDKRFLTTKVHLWEQIQATKNVLKVTCSRDKAITFLLHFQDTTIAFSTLISSISMAKVNHLPKSRILTLPVPIKLPWCRAPSSRLLLDCRMSLPINKLIITFSTLLRIPKEVQCKIDLTIP